MAQFWTASAVTTTSGSLFISVQTGDDVALISPNSFLQIGTNQFVEVKTVNTSASPQTIELFVPWNAATASGQSAIAAPTKAEIKAAADEIRLLRQTYEGLTDDISVTAVADSLVKRDPNARIKAADPLAAEDVITKNYLNSGANNIGIGTASPLTELDVRASNNSPTIRFGSGSNNGIAYWDNGAGHTVFGSEGSQDWDILFTQNSKERMRIDSSGRVSVGSTSSLNNGYLSVTVPSGAQAITAKVGSNGNSLFQGFSSSSSVVFQVRGDGLVTNNNGISATDKTTNRLMKVGDFGIGNYITLNVVDLNTVNTVHNTSYYCINCTNRPIAQNGYMQVLVNLTGQYAVQEYRPVTTNSVYHRTLSLGVWSAWSEMGTESNNSLIEFGSNANGSFTKFPDGTLICYNGLLSSSSGNTTWTYPFAFAGIVSVQATPNSSLAKLLSGFILGLTASSVSFSVWDSANLRVAVNTGIFAIGRWK